MRKRKNPTIVLKVDKNVKSIMHALATAKGIDPEIQKLAMHWKKTLPALGNMVEQLERDFAIIKVKAKIMEETNGGSH